MSDLLLHDILSIGVDEGASDWHIREGSNACVRIDTNLVEMDFLTDGSFLKQAVKQICSQKHLDSYEQRGDADFAFHAPGVGRFRGNLHKQRGLMSLTLRYVKDDVPSRQELGLPETINNLARSKNGIVIITGSTGSGKSTTMGCMIEYMNENLSHHIITIEDPIEYAFKDKQCIIEQREVGLDCVSFESALIHVLRQDPDVIVIGELRNRETFETAVSAAETGHLVLTTMHTQSAAQSILRIVDMYQHDEREAVRKSLSDSLRGIVCQRLITRATGQGVVPANEILVNTPVVSKLISDNKLDKLSKAIDSGKNTGMISFNACLLNLVNNGLITEETALGASDNAEALQMNMRGIFLSATGGIIDD